MRLRTYTVEMVLSKDGPWALKSEADREIRRQKRKRCLAMAEMCRWQMTFWEDDKDDGGWEYKYRYWCIKWHERWLKLADKFKESV